MNAPVTPAASAPILLREDAGNIAILTLNRPGARNALSEAMLAALGENLAAIGLNRAIRGDHRGEWAGLLRRA